MQVSGDQTKRQQLSSIAPDRIHEYRLESIVIAILVKDCHTGIGPVPHVINQPDFSGSQRSFNREILTGHRQRFLSPGPQTNALHCALTPKTGSVQSTS